MATAAALRRHKHANENFGGQVDELLGFLNNSFPAGHPYQNVHAVPGPWQNAENRVPASQFSPEVWILGSSPFSAQLAAKLGRPYAFALQFGDADAANALRIYREQFQPSEILSEPYALVSLGVVAHDDPEEAARQARTAGMAMLRMFKRESYSLLPPEEVENYPATLNERHVLEVYDQRFVNGTGHDVGRTGPAL